MPTGSSIRLGATDNSIRLGATDNSIRLGATDNSIRLGAELARQWPASRRLNKANIMPPADHRESRGR
jgi:hypothetical protein